jgi:hypothetical protein
MQEVERYSTEIFLFGSGRIPILVLPILLLFF